MTALDWLRAPGVLGQFAHRAAALDDVPRILEIERAAHPHPWTEGMIRDEFGVAHGVVRLGEVDGVIAGYVIAWVIVDEVHIQNVAVHPKWQRRGVASALLRSIFEGAMAHGGGRALLEVRASNAGAIALYESLGFEEIGRRRRYYADNGEDAVVMGCSMGA